MFAKIEVNGAHTHPLWAFLKQEKGGMLGNSIKWNFTKFLVGRDGEVAGRFAPTSTPESMTAEVEKLLGAAH
jgi:glutathione peroxidase